MCKHTHIYTYIFSSFSLLHTHIFLIWKHVLVHLYCKDPNSGCVFLVGLISCSWDGQVVVWMSLCVYPLALADVTSRSPKSSWSRVQPAYRFGSLLQGRHSAGAGVDSCTTMFILSPWCSPARKWTGLPSVPSESHLLRRSSSKGQWDLGRSTIHGVFGSFPSKFHFYWAFIR